MHGVINDGKCMVFRQWSFILHVGDKDLFSNLEEKDLQMNIEMGDDGKYSVIGLGMILFREAWASIHLEEHYVRAWAKEELVSIAILQDRSYDVIFSKEKVFLQHIATSQVKKTRIWLKNPWTNIGIMLYLLMSILVNTGYFSCIKRIKISQSFMSLKHWWRKSQERRLKLYGVIKVVIMSQTSLRTYVQWKGLSGS